MMMMMVIIMIHTFLYRRKVITSDVVDIKYIERSTIKITLFCYDTTYMLGLLLCIQHRIMQGPQVRYLFQHYFVGSQ